MITTTFGLAGVAARVAGKPATTASIAIAKPSLRRPERTLIPGDDSPLWRPRPAGGWPARLHRPKYDPESLHADAISASYASGHGGRRKP
ncbi:MAG: hypothetical protein ACRDKS_05280, partial [Actinomycetota bacterium]